jgi:hypothetical protein
MTAPIYIWALLIALALNKVWRRHRLVQHGLNSILVDTIKRKKDGHIHEDYIRRYDRARKRPRGSRTAARSDDSDTGRSIGVIRDRRRSAS